MSPIPQLVEDGQENNGIIRPAWRRAVSVMSYRMMEAPKHPIDPFGKSPLRGEQTHDQIGLARKIEKWPGYVRTP